jgi:hypothetical protein
MPPRRSLHPDDLVTPGKAAQILGVPGGTLRSWIHRNQVEPLGKIGRWHVYDFNELAVIAATARQNASSQAA